MENLIFRDTQANYKRWSDYLKTYSSTSPKYLRKLVNSLVHRKTQLVLFLGAGVSLSIANEPKPGDRTYEPQSWTGLLASMFERIFETDDEKLIFLEKYIPPGKELTFSTLLECYDKLRIAAFLGFEFIGKNERDALISEIVSADQDTQLVSDLLNSIKDLPFDHIITPNYDHNLENSLSPGTFEVVHRGNYMSSSSQKDICKLIYIHGRANIIGKDTINRDHSLVLDRYDYADLMSEKNGFLEYVGQTLIGAQVIYIGFGMDDPTFNLLEAMLQNYPSRPESFAFVPNAFPDELKFWGKRKLNLIPYGDAHEELPEIIDVVNRTVSFLTNTLYAHELLNLKTPSGRVVLGGSDDFVRGFLTSANEAYINGKYHLCLAYLRAALASTLVWDESLEYSKGKRSQRSMGKLLTLFEIRLKLSLVRYKLHWAPSERNSNIKYLNENIKQAKAILDALNPISNVGFKLFLAKLEFKVLDARMAYNEGKLIDAQRLYTEIETSYQKSRKNEKLTSEQKIRLANTYYYARCQLGRIRYQLLDLETGEIAAMKKLGEQIKLDYKYSLNAFSDQNEKRFFCYSLKQNYQICNWITGRQLVGMAGSIVFFGEKEKFGFQDMDEILEGINFLNDRGEELEAGNELGDVLRPSMRWETMRLRYLARGLSMLWLAGKVSRIEHDNLLNLRRSFSLLLKSLEITKEEGLERQRIMNLLELSRLNITVLFGELIFDLLSNKQPRSNELNMEACLYYLNQVFLEMDIRETLENFSSIKRGYQWPVILALRAAAFLSLIRQTAGYGEVPLGINILLRDFLISPPHQKLELISRFYKKFESLEPSAKMMGKRIDRFSVNFDYIQKLLTKNFEEVVTWANFYFSEIIDDCDRFTTKMSMLNNSFHG